MTKDEALAFDLALEALLDSIDDVRDCLNQSLPHAGYARYDRRIEAYRMQLAKHEEAITALKKVRALDKMAENARELGLDYEPAGGTQVSKVWWDGEKLMAKPIPLEDIYQPAPVQEDWGPGPHECHSLTASVQEPVTTLFGSLPVYDTLPAAQRQWVGLTDAEVMQTMSGDWTSQFYFARAIEAKLKEKNNG
jgi:hypothetical protein